MKRWSSLRRTEAPIPVALIASPPADTCRLCPVLARGLLGRAFAHGLSARGYRLDDIVVAGTAAEIALELVADGVVVEFVAFAVHDIDRRHDHARRAVAALQPVVLAKSLLHRMQRPVRFSEPLDRDDIGTVELPGKDRAGFHRLAVDVHHAGAALRGIAADMGAGQAQVLAQELHQKGARVEVAGDGLAVHRHRDGGHGVPPRNPGQLPCFSRCPAEQATERGQIARILPCLSCWNKTNSWPHPRGRSRASGHQPAATTVANFAKKSSAVFFAAELISRWPSWASLPP